MASFGLVMEYDKSEIFHFSRAHNDSNPELDLSAIGAPILKPKTYWRYLGFYFNRRLSFKEHVRFYSTKALTTVKAIGMLGNSSRGLLPLQKRLLYWTCVVPITTYGFRLWYFSGASTKAQVSLLATMQCKAALWILDAFRTSPTGKIEALAGLIPIHLHLKKLAKRLCLRATTLPFQHALLSLLSARNSKGAHPHSQSLALLTDTQSVRLRSPLLDTEALLLNLTERFNSLYPEIRPGCRLLDNFPDHVSFHPCDHSNGCTRKLQFNALDRLCHEASSDPSTLVVATDASVISPRNMQAVSVVHFWRLGAQVSSFKAPAGRATALDAELFAIRLGIVKATSFDVKCIVIITDSLTAARRAVDASVHSGQVHSLAIIQALRGFFTNHSDRSIHFWDCPSKAQWSLHFLAHEDATSTKIAAGHHPATSLDTLQSKSATACLDAWRTSFARPSSQSRHFLPLKGGIKNLLQPSYAKGGG